MSTPPDKTIREHITIIYNRLDALASEVHFLKSLQNAEVERVNTLINKLIDEVKRHKTQRKLDGY